MTFESSSAVAVVPAAGVSARMGRPKLLLPWRESTVIETVLAAWRAGGVERIVVVVRPDDEELAALCRRAGAWMVRPAAVPPDMKTSVRLALAEARQRFPMTDDDAWLLAPADMPRLSPSVIARLLIEHRPAEPRVLIPTIDGRRGHPILIPWRWAGGVAELGPDEGVNALVARLPVREIVTSDGGIRVDLDTPEDYRQAVADETSRAPGGPVN